MEHSRRRESRSVPTHFPANIERLVGGISQDLNASEVAPMIKQSRHFLSVLSVFLFASLAVQGSLQGQAYNAANQHYYEYVSVPGGLDWFAAEAAASAKSFRGVPGHLVTLTTAQENQFVFNNALLGPAWLGGFQPAGSPEPGGGWQWVTGETWDYTNWGPFEPNNSFGTEDTLVYAANAEWNDVTRTNLNGGYIVEYPWNDLALSHWKNPAGGSFQDPANWPGGFVPTGFDFTVFNLDSNGYTVTSSANINTYSLTVRNDDVTLDLGANIFNVVGTQGPMLRVADDAGESGALRIASGSVTVGGSATVGGNGHGTLEINGSVDVGGDLTVASATTSAGTVAINSGGSLDVTGSVFVGTNGNATMVVSGPGASLVATGVTRVGYYNGSGALVIEDGGQASFGDWLSIGVGYGLAESDAYGELTVRTGAMVNIAGGFGVGGFSNRSVTATGLGKATINGGSVSAENQASIGISSNTSGELLIENGGILSTSIGLSTTGTSGFVGTYVSSYGLVRVTGAGSRWINDGLLVVGWEGTGELHVENGGRVESARGQLGRSSTGVGTVEVTGTGSTWKITQDLTVGGTELAQAGQGLLEVKSGGLVEVGTDLRVWESSVVDVSNQGVINVGNVIGATPAGTVKLGGNTALRGYGIIKGNVHVVGQELVFQPPAARATVAPGNGGAATGRLTIEGNYLQKIAGDLEIDLAGPQPATQYDQLFITGQAALDGGRLRVALAGGFTPVVGDSFKVLDWGSRTGAFYSSSLNLPSLPSGRSWDTRKLNTNGVLSVTPTPTTIANWTFEPGKPGNPVSASGTTLSGVSPATGNGVASGFHASAATVWDNPAGNGSAESMSSNNWVVGDYYQFQVSTDNLQDIQLAFQQISSSSGPRDFQLQYSTNGSLFTNFGNVYAVRTNVDPAWNASTPSGSDSFSFDLSSITSINDQATLYLRLAVASTVSAGGGTIGSGGTSRLDNVTIWGTPLYGLAGDYNLDGVVDAADYTVWRKSSGQTGAGLPADANRDGAVTQADYEIWRARFGNSAASGSGAGSTVSATVPEPASTAMLFCLTAAVACVPVRRAGQR